MSAQSAGVPPLTISEDELQRIRASYTRKGGRDWAALLGRAWFWILIIVILASCCIGLATRTPRRARQHRLGRPATAVSVAQCGFDGIDRAVRTGMYWTSTVPAKRRPPLFTTTGMRRWPVS